MGISTLLAEKIKQLNHAIQIVDTLKLEDINNYHFEGIDLLITTHDFDTSQLYKYLKSYKYRLYFQMKMLKNRILCKSHAKPIIKR